MSTIEIKKCDFCKEEHRADEGGEYYFFRVLSMCIQDTGEYSRFIGPDKSVPLPLQNVDICGRCAGTIMSMKKEK